MTTEQIHRLMDARNDLSDLINTYLGVYLSDEKLERELNRILDEFDAVLPKERP